MAYALICTVALLAAGLTFFSGFGLGTLLLPAFAVFLPVEIAVGATAVVHLANNLFKGALLWRHVSWRAAATFGLPAAGAAFIGAALLGLLAEGKPLTSWRLAGAAHEITPASVLIGLLITVFALFDLWPRLRRLQFGRRWLPIGGALSGFFGGLSGHQGALRSAFLVKAGLGRDGFIATGVACSILVDVVRLPVYGATLAEREIAGGTLGLMGAGAGAAFVGSFIGSRLVRKTTIDAVQTIVGIGLMLVGAAMAVGLI